MVTFQLCSDVITECLAGQRVALYDAVKLRSIGEHQGPAGCARPAPACKGLLPSFSVTSSRVTKRRGRGCIAHAPVPGTVLDCYRHCPLSLHPSPVPIVQMRKLRLRMAKCLVEPKVTGKTGRRTLSSLASKSLPPSCLWSGG